MQYFPLEPGEVWVDKDGKEWVFVEETPTKECIFTRKRWFGLRRDFIEIYPKYGVQHFLVRRIDD